MHPTEKKENKNENKIPSARPSSHPLVRLSHSLLHGLQLLRAGQETRHHPVTLVVLAGERLGLVETESGEFRSIHEDDGNVVVKECVRPPSRVLLFANKCEWCTHPLGGRTDLVPSADDDSVCLGCIIAMGKGEGDGIFRVLRQLRHRGVLHVAGMAELLHTCGVALVTPG